MISIRTMSIFLLVAALGVGLRGRGRPRPTSTHALGTKASKLEEELQTAQSARDHLGCARVDGGTRGDQATAGRHGEKNAAGGSDHASGATLQSQYETFRRARLCFRPAAPAAPSRGRHEPGHRSQPRSQKQSQNSDVRSQKSVAKVCYY